MVYLNLTKIFRGLFIRWCCFAKWGEIFNGICAGMSSKTEENEVVDGLWGVSDSPLIRRASVWIKE